MEQEVHSIAITWADSPSFDALAAWCGLITLQRIISLSPAEYSERRLLYDTRNERHRKSLTYPAPSFSTFSARLHESQSLSNVLCGAHAPVDGLPVVGCQLIRGCVSPTDHSPRYTIVCKPSPALHRGVGITTACGEEASPVTILPGRVWAAGHRKWKRKVPTVAGRMSLKTAEPLPLGRTALLLRSLTSVCTKGPYKNGSKLQPTDDATVVPSTQSQCSNSAGGGRLAAWIG